jgi:hypothetical protein
MGQRLDSRPKALQGSGTSGFHFTDAFIFVTNWLKETYDLCDSKKYSFLASKLQSKNGTSHKKGRWGGVCLTFFISILQIHLFE